jgi:hypothetical protein
MLDRGELDAAHPQDAELSVCMKRVNDHQVANLFDLDSHPEATCLDDFQRFAKMLGYVTKSPKCDDLPLQQVLRDSWDVHKSLHRDFFRRRSQCSRLSAASPA